MVRYKKVCIENNPNFSVYYGTGKYFSAEQNSLLHYDTNLSISYMLHCSGNIKIEGKQYRIQSGDVVITNPGEIHCCSIDDGTYHERISICINKSILNNFCFDCEDFFDFFEQSEKGVGNIISSEIVSGFKLGNLISQIYLLSKNKNNKNKILAICKIIEFLDQLGKAATQYTLKLPSYPEENSTVSKAIEYVNKHFAEDINCTKIAEKLFLSKYRLEHLFTENVGIPLWDYVVIKRLMLVNKLIQEKHSAEEASYTAGFHNYSNFYRLYKKYFNMTPTEYKKLLKQ